MEQRETLTSRPYRFEVSSWDICYAHPNIAAVLRATSSIACVILHKMSALEKVVDMSELLDRSHVGIFIGKNGCNLKKIESDTKVIMQIEKEDNKNTLRIRLTGHPFAVEAAQIEINELAIQILRRSFCRSVRIPTSLIGPLIGRKGHSINAIRDVTGVKIDIGRSGEDGFTAVEIYGDYRQTVIAVNLIKDHLNTFISVASGHHPLNQSEQRNLEKNDCVS